MTRAIARLAAGVTCATGLALAAAGVGPASAAPSVRYPAGQLNAVSASAAGNAWTVGCSPGVFSCPDGVDAAYHWNGTAWKRVAVPMPVPPNPQDTESGQLTGVKVISARDIWAVGTSSPTGAQIVHWNGTAWKQVTVPALRSPYGRSYSLSAVTATSARNVWAVGSGGNNQTIILHFNGTSWKRVASPSPGSSWLYGVTATSASNAWAVGTDNGSCACNKALILHWNGKSWKVALNSYASFQTFLTSVSASSATSAWAGGLTRVTVNPTLLLHWNGTAWKRVTSGLPQQSGAYGEAAGMAATSARNAWEAPGYSANHSILRWNGTAWKKATSSTQSLDYFGMAATSARNAWAVGDAPGTVLNTDVLIMAWNGKSWRRQSA